MIPILLLFIGVEPKQIITLELLPDICLAPCPMEARITLSPDVPIGAEVCFTLDSERSTTKSCFPAELRNITVRVSGFYKGIYTVGAEALGERAEGVLVVN